MKHPYYILFTTYFILILNACQAETINNTDPMDDTTYTFLALGDSYTIGEGVPENERWPMLLVADLMANGLAVDTPLIIARTGWTTAELAAGIDQANPKGPFDLVSLLIGVNNQYRGPSRGYSQEAYRQEFAALLQQAIDFAGGKQDRVFVVSIPDYSVTPFVSQTNKERIAREIDEYNAINKEEAGHAGVSYFDITPISRNAAIDPSLIAPDNLHPSGKMYKQWVDLMLPQVKEKMIRKK
jgi:acyl-CoA thioesterase I